MCKECGVPRCTCTRIISKKGATGARGRAGRDGRDAFITVKDNTTTVSGVKEIRFTDSNAVVTDLGNGIAQVNFTPAATVWNDILNIPWYVTGSESIKPQYTVDGNRITFRGLLFIPLLSGGVGINVNGGNAYLAIPSSTTNDAALSVITNANTNNGTPQGRFMTTNIVTSKNLPTQAIPVGRDIVFDNVFAVRRYDDGSRVTNFRSVVSLRIGSTMTLFKNGPTNIGSGCIMVFSPFQGEYDGSGIRPLGNDPLALLISRATGGNLAADYVNSLDDNPFTVPSAGANSPFDTNAHNISSLGGYIINLEGLSGYLN